MRPRPSGSFMITARVTHQRITCGLTGPPSRQCTVGRPSQSSQSGPAAGLASSPSMASCSSWSADSSSVMSSPQARMPLSMLARTATSSSVAQAARRESTDCWGAREASHSAAERRISTDGSFSMGSARMGAAGDVLSRRCTRRRTRGEAVTARRASLGRI